MKSKYFIGIDTSCYTTSVAAIDESKNLVYDGRIPIVVEQGSRGLRQSEAVFQHTNNIVRLVQECLQLCEPQEIVCIAVSSKPRNTESSYMPVFTAGLNTAKTMAACLGVPLFEASHQEGHVIAAIWSSKRKLSEDFLAYHISGGTTELLKIKLMETLDIDIIGGSNDLKAGQFIDRTGVAMGMGFPCGREMDRLSCECKDEGILIPIHVEGCYTSFSGPETFVQRLIKDGNTDSASICKGVFLCIAKSLEKTIANACGLHNLDQILIAGGVASNTLIRSYIESSKKLDRSGIEVIFCKQDFSSDNAVGTALYGRKSLIGGGFND